MRFYISIVVLILFNIKTIAQNWAIVSNDKFNDYIEYLIYDSIHNKLIASSKFISKVGNMDAWGAASWNGIKWDSLAGGINSFNKGFQTFPNGSLISGVPYNGKFLAGGFFTSVGKIKTTGLALWDGNNWDTLPKRAFRNGKEDIVITGFLKKGNLLYISGMFDTISGQVSNGLAAWDGLNFNSISLPASPGFQGIFSMINYQNELYITGDVFDIGSQHARDILKFNGSSWVSTTGGGLHGGFSSVGDLIIYNNELYACGHFTTSDGDPANNIMKWNGMQWIDIGFDNTASFIGINKMLVYKNKLWVFGSFSKVANEFTSNVAIYDGISWCGLKDTLDNTIGSATVYNDTIYISGGFWKANSDSIPYIAKLKDPNLFSQCVNVGIHELTNNNQINIYPNPVTSIINITDEQNQLQNSTIEIVNYLGQVILSLPFSKEVDVSKLASGFYNIKIRATNGEMYYSKFVKE